MAKPSLITRRLFLRAIPPTLIVTGALAAPGVAEGLPVPESENDLVLRVLHRMILSTWTEAHVRYAANEGDWRMLDGINHLAEAMVIIPANSEEGCRLKDEVADLTYASGSGGVSRLSSHDRLRASALADRRIGERT